MKEWNGSNEEPLRAQTLGSVLAAHAKSRPHSEAFVGQNFEPITYAQLSKFVTSLSAQLSSFGIPSDACVGLAVPSGPVGAALVVGIAASAILVPINPALSSSELVEEIRRTNMRALVVLEEHVDKFSRYEDSGILIISASCEDGFLPVLKMRSTPSPLMRAARIEVAKSSVAILLRSSGTTATAKLFGVTHQNLLSMSEKMADWFSLSHSDRVACTLPLFYAAGLKTTLFVPLFLGASIGFPSTEAIFDVCRWVEKIRPTYLSVAPTPLRAMLDRLRNSDRPVDLSFLRFAICGAAYLPNLLRIEAEQLLGVAVLEYYALSEAGAMAANPAPPRLRKPGTVGLFRPTELALVDDAGQPVATGQTGAICISGPSVTPSRVGMEFVPAGPFAGWLLTGDLGKVDFEDYLTIVGRTKDIINRGGEKVSPYEVEKVLLQHPDVVDAGVFGTPHPRWGESVAAAVVLKPQTSTTPLDVKVFAASRLTSFKIPTRIDVVDELPRGPTGKLLRKSLSEKELTLLDGQLAQPDRMLEHQIIEIWQHYLKRSDFGIDDDFFELGGDSLLALEMLEEVEALFCKQIPQSQLSPSLTVRTLTDAICLDLGGSRELMTQVQSAAGTAFFFCHGDHVSRGLYANRLLSQLGPEQSIFFLHFYMSMHRDDLTIEEIAQLYLREIIQAYPEGAVIVGGYCNGALVAWELARLLQASGREVQKVLLVEAPSLNARPLFRTLNQICIILSAVLPKSFGTIVEQKGMRAFWHRLRGSRGFWSWPTLLKSLLSSSRSKAKEATAADPPSPHWLYLRTIARFIPKRLNADVTCFIALDGYRSDADPDQWKRLARSVNVIELPGTHYTLVTSKATMLGVAMRKAMRGE